MKTDYTDPIKITDESILNMLKMNPYLALLLQEIDIEIERVLAGEDLEDKDDEQAKINIADSSCIITRTKTLKKDFVQKLQKISKEKGFPFTSVIQLYRLFAYTGLYTDALMDITNNVYPDCPRDLFSIDIPQDIPEDKQEDAAIAVWKRIYEVMKECIYVFSFTAAVETLYSTAIYRVNGLGDTKKRLMLTALTEELVKSVNEIHSQTDLQEYFRNNLSCFIVMIYDILNSFKKFLNTVAYKRLTINNIPIHYRLYDENGGDKASQQKTTIDINNKTSNPRLEFIHFSLLELTNRLISSNGFLQNYKLGGDCHSLVIFVQSCFTNISKRFTEKHQDDLMKEKWQISKRQSQRLERRLDAGERNLSMTMRHFQQQFSVALRYFLTPVC